MHMSQLQRPNLTLATHPPNPRLKLPQPPTNALCRPPKLNPPNTLPTTSSPPIELDPYPTAPGTSKHNPTTPVLSQRSRPAGELASGFNSILLGCGSGSGWIGGDCRCISPGQRLCSRVGAGWFRAGLDWAGLGWAGMERTVLESVVSISARAPCRGSGEVAAELEVGR